MDCLCTDDDDWRDRQSTPVPILHRSHAMDEKRSAAERLGGLEGADEAGLGIDATPHEAPPGATIQDDVRLVPGADFDERRRDEAKPWSTSLAAASGQAGVANDPRDADDKEPSPEDAARP